jgi:dolichol-phosphate mannosyltransferase
MNGITNSNHRFDLTLVIPFYEEKENIIPLSQELEELLKKANNIYPASHWTLLWVNDGSRDGGEKVLLDYWKDKKSNFYTVKLLELSQNSGLSTALWAGIEKAEGDFIVTIDSDLQNDPIDILKLLDKFFENPVWDGVFGIRANRHDSWVKKMSSRVANGIRNFFLQDGVTDTGCTLKLFKTEKLQSLPFFKGMHRFFPFLYRLKDYKFITVDVNHRFRQYGKAKYHLYNRLIGPTIDLLAAYWMLKKRIKYGVKNIIFLNK